MEIWDAESLPEYKEGAAMYETTRSSEDRALSGVCGVFKELHTNPSYYPTRGNSPRASSYMIISRTL
jgi:hypothetical protein